MTRRRGLHGRMHGCVMAYISTSLWYHVHVWKVIKSLLAADADPNAADQWGRTALHRLATIDTKVCRLVLVVLRCESPCTLLCGALVLRVWVRSVCRPWWRRWRCW